MGLFDNIDVEATAKEVDSARSVEVRDPLLSPYGDESKMTASQEEIWRFRLRHMGTPSVLAIIGAKGSGKTHAGACFDVYNAQKYPGSLGCIISNTYQQAKDNAVPELLKAARRVQVPIKFYTNKTIYGQPRSSVFVLDVDGEGFEKGQLSYVLLRSFESVQKIEGAELDYLHAEEIQDTDQDKLALAISRVRGTIGDDSIFLAGMPEDELHWQYEFVENQIAQAPFCPAHSDSEVVEKARKGNGMLLEPALIENVHNVGQDYINRLRSIYGGAEAERLIDGKRASVDKNKVFHRFSTSRHYKGTMPQILSGYDQSRDIYFVFDFNVAPMSVTAWQIKPWTDRWLSPNLTIDGDTIIHEMWDEDTNGEQVRSMVEYDSLSDFAEPERKVAVCIDQFEIWNGGTRATCEAIVEKYGGHTAGIGVFGDASSDRENTVTTENDYDIIEETIGALPNSYVRRGLIQNGSIESGGVRTSNPPVKETTNASNKLLSDPEGKAHVCFAPDNEYPSGGVVKSVSLLERKPDGNIDKSNDRKDGRSVPRSHFSDTFRYFAWWFNGEGGATPEEVERQIEEAEEAMRAADLAASRYGNGRSAFGF